jgi:hypothetical protein
VQHSLRSHALVAPSACGLKLQVHQTLSFGCAVTTPAGQGVDLMIPFSYRLFYRFCLCTSFLVVQAAVAEAGVKCALHPCL